MVTLTTYSNLSVKNLVHAIRTNKKSRYVMLYLYDGIEEMFNKCSVTTRLFTNYGKRINSRLGRDIPFLTVYDKQVIDAWGDDYMGKEKLMKQFSYQQTCSQNNYYSLMEKLAFLYDVRLPALVLIDTNGKERSHERVAKKEFKSWSAEEIYQYIIKLIDAIRDYYGDFERISFECKADSSFSEKNIKEELAVQPSLKEIVEEYLHVAKCKKKELCEKLGIDPKTLRRYLSEWDPKTGKSYPLPRDTAIAIAFILKLTPEKADAMFDSALAQPIPRLGNSERDEIIRECLKYGIDLETTNQKLATHQLSTVNI